MNTARAFGPAAVSGFPNGNHWIVRWHFYFNHLHPPPHTSSPPLIHLVPVPVSSHFWFFRAVTRGKKIGKRERDPLTHMSPRPHAFDMIDKERNADDTCWDIFHFTCGTGTAVLGGPISRRTASHLVIRHLETVRHDFLSHNTTPPSDTHTRGIPPFLVFYFAFLPFRGRGAWKLTQRNG
jgi:hypothetical protein